MSLPDKYKYLEQIGPLPRAVEAALKYLGVHEVVGPGSNPIILAMAKRVGVGDIYTDDDISWCALFVADTLIEGGKPMKYTSWAALRAASFKTWGEEVPFDDIRLGDIAVFDRPGGHHVGYPVAVSLNAEGALASVHVLGGNQSNKVGFAELPASRLAAVRRFYAVGPPASAKQYILDSSGKMSVNEA